MKKKFALMFLLLISFLSNTQSSVILSDKADSISKIKEIQNCNLPLINSFVYMFDFSSKTTPSKTTKFQKEYCPTIENTCCEDSLFNHLLKNIKEKLSKIKFLIDKHIKILKKIEKIPISTFNSIFENLNYFNLKNSKIDIDKLELEFTKIRENPKLYISRAKKGFNYLIQNNFSILCDLCAAYNQNQFKVFDKTIKSPHNNILKLNVNFCFQTLQNKAIESFSDLLNDISNLNKIVYFLNKKYKTGLTRNHLLEMAKDETDFTYKDDDCRNYDYFINNLKECVELCKEVGMLNENPLAIFSVLLASNFVVLNDYFSQERMFKKLKEDFEMRTNYKDLKKGPKVQDNEYIRFKEQRKVKLQISRYNMFESSDNVLTPANKSLYNFNIMPIEYNSDKGWKNYSFNREKIVFLYKIHNFSKFLEILSIFLLLVLVKRF